MDHILSEEEIATILEDLDKISSCINHTKTNLNTVINNFESNPVVESFFASGNFGKINQEALKEIRNCLEEYESCINGDSGLMVVTRNFLQNQQSRVQSGE